MAHILTVADSNLPVKFSGKSVFGADFSVSKKINLEDRTLTIVGSDETNDRDGDVITCTRSSWVVENFMKNPVFLWAHDYKSIPIGKTTKLTFKSKPRQLVFNIMFPPEGLYPMADMILQLYGMNIINTSSVGFIPWKWEKLADEDLPKDGPPAEMFWSRNRFLKQELLELSGCAVPSNPSAILTDSLPKEFSAKQFGGVSGSEFLKNVLQGTSPEPSKKDDILHELSLAPFEYKEEDGSVSVFMPSPEDITLNAEEEVSKSEDSVVTEEGDGDLVPPSTASEEVSTQTAVDESISKINESIQNIQSKVEILTNTLDALLAGMKDHKSTVSSTPEVNQPQKTVVQSILAPEPPLKTERAKEFVAGLSYTKEEINKVLQLLRGVKELMNVTSNLIPNKEN